MKTATVAGICAVLLVLAGFSLSHLSSRNKELSRSIMSLRLENKALSSTIETHEKALKEAEENARKRQESLEAALYAAGNWANTDLPDSVRQLLHDSAANCLSASRPSLGADSNSRQIESKNSGRSGSALN